MSADPFTSYSATATESSEAARGQRDGRADARRGRSTVHPGYIPIAPLVKVYVDAYRLAYDAETRRRSAPDKLALLGEISERARELEVGRGQHAESSFDAGVAIGTVMAARRSDARRRDSLLTLAAWALNTITALDAAATGSDPA